MTYAADVGFFMNLRGEDAPSAGHAGLIDALAEVFSPSKSHTTEQQQYDESVGRRPTTDSGRPLDFQDNKIHIVVKKQPKAADDS